MIILNDHILLKNEWDICNKFKPSLLQKLINIFFPVYPLYLKKLYRGIKREDCG